MSNNPNARITVLLLILAPMFLCSCATTDLVTGRETKNLYDISDDIDMGFEGIEEFKAEFSSNGVPINVDTDTLEHLQNMVADIADVNNLTNFPFDVTLFETNIVNAMALPGGQLIAFPGLWDEKEGMVKDDSELAAVFSHEIAHVTCRHSTEELTKLLPYEILLGGAFLYAELDENEDLATAIGAAFLLYQGLLVPKYSRIDESEADRVGMMYMARAGYDPRAAIRVWKRLHESEGSDLDILSIFSTHPTHEDRYKNLEEHLPEALALYEASDKKKPSTDFMKTQDPEKKPNKKTVKKTGKATFRTEMNDGE